MTLYSAQAAEQVRSLIRFYVSKGRPEAVTNLQDALARAEQGIDQQTGQDLYAPRPYPALGRPGLRWLKTGRYWISYSVATPPVIHAVFHDSADIPARL